MAETKERKPIQPNAVKRGINIIPPDKNRCVAFAHVFTPDFHCGQWPRLQRPATFKLKLMEADYTDNIFVPTEERERGRDRKKGETNIKVQCSLFRKIS